MAFWNRLNLSKPDNNKQIVEKAKQIIINLAQTSQNLTKKDISAWRRAHQMALNIENPKRTELYNIYDYTTNLDSHIEGVTLRINSKIKQMKFRVLDRKTREENQELTDLFEAIWFKDFISLCIETKWYGHSLIEFGNVVSNEGGLAFDRIELVPRVHVCPEYGVLLKETSDEPQNGIPYRKGSFADWAIEIGRPKDLGKFLKATPHAISKKHVSIFWDNFAERFGIPIIYTTSDTRNETERIKIENMMRNMGNSAWGLFPTGTELKLIETSKGDAFQVFDMRLERADKQMSKCLAGQTMAFDEGSSLSQGQIHQEGFEDVMNSYADDVKDIINTSLFPFLIRHGFPLQGYRFEWDDTYEFTPEEIQQEEGMLLSYFDIDPEYFINRYNIPIIGKKENPFMQPGMDLKKKSDSSPLSWRGDGGEVPLNKPAYLTPLSSGEGSGVRLSKSDTDRLQNISAQLIRQVWDDSEITFSWDLFQKTHSLLFDSLSRGILNKKQLQLSTPLSSGEGSGVRSIYNHRNQAAITMMEANIFRFSAAKSQAAVIELNQMAREAKNFTEFNDTAQAVLDDYNGTYLRTEYMNAYQTGTMAAAYWEMKELADIYPTWIYKTMEDEHVRPAHQVLNNLILAADDPAWKQIYPPNGWRCRCHVVPDYNDPPAHAEGEKALQELAKAGVDKNGNSELDRMRKQGFAVNRAETEVAFTESQMYIKQFEHGSLSVRDMYGTRDMNWIKINKEKLPERAVNTTTKEDALKWFENKKDSDNRVSFQDYAGRKIKLDSETVKEHLNQAIQKYKNRHELIDLIPEILSMPDEVWFDLDEKLYMYKYLKMFQDEMVMVVANFRKGKPLRILSWYDIHDDSNRKGILIKKKK